MKTYLSILLLIAIGLCQIGCNNEVLKYDDPDVDLFVKQLKAGTYQTKSPAGYVEVPLFNENHIPELLDYVDDLTIIPSFPLPPISSYFGEKIRLGECMLWIIESIRLGHPASLGCKMVYANADNYEGIFFLSDEEVLEVAQLYKNWWEGRSFPKTRWSVDPCFDDPLCRSGYRWW
ncbi:MAG: DUF4943 family protein [Bacteroidales bacterium]|nr:DUF4943 family protein [Bacteroidales bacterium]